MPPKKGPIDCPKYTHGYTCTKSRPRSLAGNIAISMATDVLASIAELAPCKARNVISITVELEMAIAIVETVSSIIPKVNIFLIPTMSAILPKGTEKTAMARIKEVTTQLKRTASG